jgi:hypothetical protein
MRSRRVDIFRLMPPAISFTLYTGGYKEMSSILADQEHLRMLSPTAGRWGEGGGGFAGSQPMSKAVRCAQEAQINFGDLTPHISYECF